jgi:trk system potassium uptake protein TrkA
MATRRNVAVLGLGRFGQSVALELSRLGHDVLAVDVDEKQVAQIADSVTHAVQADLTDGDALAELGLGDFDTVIVAMSSRLEASIIAIAHVRQLGSRRIVAKAGSDLHGSILRQVGATRVVYPERETGQRLARSFAAPGVLDYLDVAPGYGIARVRVDVGLDGRRIAELGLAETVGLTVIGLHRGGRVTLNPPDGEVHLEHLPGAGPG